MQCYSGRTCRCIALGRHFPMTPKERSRTLRRMIADFDQLNSQPTNRSASTRSSILSALSTTLFRFTGYPSKRLLSDREWPAYGRCGRPTARDQQGIRSFSSLKFIIQLTNSTIINTLFLFVQLSKTHHNLWSWRNSSSSRHQNSTASYPCMVGWW